MDSTDVRTDLRVLKHTMTSIGEILGFEDRMIRCFQQVAPPEDDYVKSLFTSTPCSIINEVSLDIPGAYVSAEGIISLVFLGRIKVDITVDGAVSLINGYQNCAAVLSANGQSSAMWHSHGNIYQDGPITEMVGFPSQDGGRNKHVRIYEEGITFANDVSGLAHMVQKTGTIPVYDNFCCIGDNFLDDVFYRDSKYGPQYVQEARDILERSHSCISRIGTYNIVVNDIYVAYQANGVVLIDKNLGDCCLRTSIVSGFLKLSTVNLTCIAELDEHRTLTVHSNGTSVYYDGVNLILFFNGSFAGFFGNEQLKIF